MRPKHLKSPFTWDDRKSHFEDRVLYVPNYYTEHQEWGEVNWSDFQFFGNNHPISIEFCSGNGAWILERALAFPEKNWIAVEKRFDRARKIWAKIKNYQLSNLIVVCGEAESFIDHYVAEDSATEIYINFPDPWPKDRHAKNRIVKEPFITSLSKVCKKGAIATFATDDPSYSLNMISKMNQNQSWKSLLPDPCFITDLPGYGSSYFDEMFRMMGRQIFYMQFINTKLDL